MPFVHPIGSSHAISGAHLDAPFHLLSGDVFALSGAHLSPGAYAPLISSGLDVQSGTLGVLSEFSLSGTSHAVSYAVGGMSGIADLVGSLDALSGAQADLKGLQRLIGQSNAVSGAVGGVTALVEPVLVVASVVTNSTYVVSGFALEVEVSDSTSWPVTATIEIFNQKYTLSIPNSTPLRARYQADAGQRWPDSRSRAGLGYPVKVTFKNPEDLTYVWNGYATIYEGAEFRWGETDPATNTVSFNASNYQSLNQDYIISYRWLFGDSAGDVNTPDSTDTDPVHAYAAPGTYKVTLFQELALYDDVVAGTTTAQFVSTTKTIEVLGAAPSFRPKLKNFRYEDVGEPLSEMPVGSVNDKKLRGVYPIPNRRLLIVTESGAYLYHSDTMVLINRVRLTNRESQLVPFTEWDGSSWASEVCSVPFFHVNVNYLGDGRNDPFGFIVVRRTPNVTVVDEDRGSQGIATKTYAHWNIHFDPFDLSAPGPVIGQFHFLKDGTLTPDEYDLQEVTFLEGCSVNGKVEDHASGYRGAGVTLNPFLGENLLDTRPNRFWDSYLVFSVLFETEIQFAADKPWNETERHPALRPIPRSLSAHLVFANGGCRGPEDPQLKLVRIHYLDFRDQADEYRRVLYPDFAGHAGSWVGYRIQNEKLPIGLEYIPGRVMETVAGVPKTLWAGNFLYSNLYPDNYGSSFTQAWLSATQTQGDQRALNTHGLWPEAVWSVWDNGEGIDAINYQIYYGNSWTNLDVTTFDDVEDWGVQPNRRFKDRRKDGLSGMSGVRFLDIVPAGQVWLPSPFLAGGLTWQLWGTYYGQKIVYNNNARYDDRASNVPPLIRRFALYGRAVAMNVPPTTPDATQRFYRTFNLSSFGQVDENGGLFGPSSTIQPPKMPWIQLNTIRGWETLKTLIATSQYDGVLDRVMVTLETPPGNVAFYNTDVNTPEYTVAIAAPGGV